MNRAVSTQSQPAQPTIIAPQGNVVAKLRERFGNLGPLVARRNSQVVKDALREWHPLRAGDEEKARYRLSRIPDRLTLHDQLNELWAAVWLPAQEVEARLIVATMLEAIPAAKASANATYIDAMTDALASADGEFDDDGCRHYQRWHGFGCAVLFDMMRKTIAISTFTPSTAEVLATARAIRLNYWRAFETTDRLIALRLNAEEIIGEASDDEIEGDAIDW